MLKKVHLLCCLLPVLALATACKTSPSKKEISKTSVQNVSPPLDKNVSLISLIAIPEKYNGRLIRIKGFLNLEFEGNAIYLHREDCDLGIDKDGLWIDIENSQIDSLHCQNCNKQYVIIEGTFEMNNRGHNNGYSGAMTKITRMELLK